MIHRPVATIQLFLSLPIKAYRGKYDWLDRIKPSYAVLSFLILTAMPSILIFPAALNFVRYYDLPISSENYTLDIVSSFILGAIHLFAASLALWLVCRRTVTFSKALIMMAALATCKIGWGLIPLIPAATIIFIEPTFFFYVLAGFLPVAAVMATYFLALTIVVFKRALGISTGRAFAAFGCILVFVPLISFLPNRVLYSDAINEEKLFLHFRNHVYQTRYIASTSLEPALLHGDRILVSLQKSDFPPAFREIWVFYRPGSSPLTPEQIVESSHGRYDDHAMIKRVAGVAGDHIEINPGVGLRRNGQIIENWPMGQLPADSFDVTVPADHVFMLGDNLNQSLDSRNFGCVPISNLVGRAVYIFYPFNRMGEVM